MEIWLRQFFFWLPEGGVYYALIGAVAYLESIVAVGLLMPGSVLCVFAGFLAFHGKGSILYLIVVTAAGALLGDTTSYVLGARSGGRILRTGIMQRRKDLVQRAELFFAAHGGKGVFIGRFLGPIRGLVPFVAGCAQMRPGPFWFWTFTSSLLWGLAYPGVGYVGGASWQQVQTLSKRLSLLILALAVLMILNVLFWRQAVPRLASWGNRAVGFFISMANSPAAASFAHRNPRIWAFLGDRLSPRRGSGLYLTVGFLLCLLFGSLFIDIALQSRLHEPLQRLDLWAEEMVRALRHPAGDVFFLAVTQFGGITIILLVGSWAFLALILFNRDFSALILIIGLAGGRGLVFLLKAFFQRPRPAPIDPSLIAHSASFPSAHAFTSLVFYGLLAYLAIDHVRDWQNRIYLILVGSGTALLVAFSRIYLGMHWLSDVLGGLVLAALWLTFLITASEFRRRTGGELPWHRGLKPIRLSRVARWSILALTGLIALAGIVIRIASRLEQFG